jgi:hypothetical protein
MIFRGQRSHQRLNSCWGSQSTPFEDIASGAHIEYVLFDLSHLPLAEGLGTNLRSDIASWVKEHKAFTRDDVALLLYPYSSVFPESMMVAKACPCVQCCMVLPVGSSSVAFRNILIATQSSVDARTRLSVVHYQARGCDL